MPYFIAVACFCSLRFTCFSFNPLSLFIPFLFHLCCIYPFSLVNRSSRFFYLSFSSTIKHFWSLSWEFYLISKAPTFTSFIRHIFRIFFFFFFLICIARLSSPTLLYNPLPGLWSTYRRPCNLFTTLQKLLQTAAVDKATQWLFYRGNHL